MAKKQSAGILLYKIENNELQVFLVHPGGPFWKHKDAGAWSIPKGEFTDDEKPLDAAMREFEEETGTKLSGDFTELGTARQKSGKIIYAWAIEGNIDPSTVVCNTFEMEWPSKSKKMQSFPEVDKGEWLSIEDAKIKIVPGQISFIEELVKKLL